MPSSSSSEPLPIPSSCPFKDQKANSLISYIPWTKAELRITMDAFPKVTEDPHRFAEEFNIVIQTYQSDLYELVYMLVGEGQDQHWMKTAEWENPERSLGLQP